MSAFDTLVTRNHGFADSEGHLGTSIMPTLGLGILTCLDPRVDPAAFLGLQLSEAMVLRNAGGRVTERVIADLSLTTYLGQLMGSGTGIEVAVIHHTGCGTGFLADESFRAAYAEHSGYDPSELSGEAVTDPHHTVRIDTTLLLTHPLLPDALTVSGHVYDLDTGLIHTVVEPTRHTTRGPTGHPTGHPTGQEAPAIGEDVPAVAVAAAASSTDGAA